MEDDSKKKSKLREVIEARRKEANVSDIESKRKEKLEKQATERPKRVMTSSSGRERAAMQSLYSGNKEGIPKEGLEALEQNQKRIAKTMLAGKNSPDASSVSSPLESLSREESSLATDRKMKEAEEFRQDLKRWKESMSQTQKQITEAEAKRAALKSKILRGAAKGIKGLGVAGSIADFLFNSGPIATDEQELSELKKDRLMRKKQKDEE